MEDDIRKLADVRPNASVSVDARTNNLLDRSVQNTVRFNSVAVSTKSMDQRMRQEELDKVKKASEVHQREVDELRLRIRELDQEVAKQKDSYMRKSSAKMPLVQ